MQNKLVFNSLINKFVLTYSFMSSQSKPSVPTIEGVKKQWQALGDIYQTMDCCPQTFFYTLTNLLKLDSAQKILEVACGTGKMIPMALDLKNPKAQYYATDISDKMLSLLEEKLSNHFAKYQSKLTLTQWMEKVNLKLGLVNGEEDLASQLKDSKPQDLKQFDRIIANLVIMLTPDPQKMLKNLYAHSKSGCLLGLTVWGSKADNNFYTLFPELCNQLGLPQAPQSRSNFHLYKKVTEMAEKSGWELVLNWDQKAFYPYLDAQSARPYGHICVSRMAHLNVEQQKRLEEAFVKKLKEILQLKNPLSFGGECYIFTKK